MALTPEDYREISRRHKAFMDEWHKDCEETRKRELAKQGLTMIETPKDKEYRFHGDGDHPNTMEDSSAIVLYLIVMFGGAIFVDRWLIWIIATVIFIKFITRHNK